MIFLLSLMMLLTLLHSEFVRANCQIASLAHISRILCACVQFKLKNFYCNEFDSSSNRIFILRTLFRTVSLFHHRIALAHREQSHCFVHFCLLVYLSTWSASHAILRCAPFASNSLGSNHNTISIIILFYLFDVINL